MSLIIHSWNVNSLKVRQSQVLDYFLTRPCDVLCLQEIKQESDKVDSDFFVQKGVHIYAFGQKTYNGVALLSKMPLTDIRLGIPHFADPQARVITAQIADLKIVNVYVPNGKEVGDEKYDYKLRFLTALKGYLSDLLQENKKIVVVGDFNIAPSDLDIYDPQKWQDTILCSSAERKALNELLEIGFSDAFRKIHPDRKQFSWWDYRSFAYRRNLGLRIDLTLVSHALSIENADIDEQPRKHERPSDHTPVWVEVK